MTRSTTTDGSVILRFTATERVAGGLVSAAVIAVLVAIGLGARAEARAQTSEMVKMTVEMKYIGGTITDHEARIRELEHGDHGGES